MGPVRRRGIPASCWALLEPLGSGSRPTRLRWGARLRFVTGSADFRRSSCVVLRFSRRHHRGLVLARAYAIVHLRALLADENRPLSPVARERSAVPRERRADPRAHRFRTRSPRSNATRITRPSATCAMRVCCQRCGALRTERSTVPMSAACKRTRRERRTMRAVLLRASTLTASAWLSSDTQRALACWSFTRRSYS